MDSEWSVGGIILAALASLLLIGAIVFGGWELGWWFNNQNANREAHLIRNSYANQQTLRDQITALIEQVRTEDTQIAEVPSAKLQIRAQEKDTVNRICADAAQLTGDPLSDQSQLAFISQNCDAGSVSPSSRYNI